MSDAAPGTYAEADDLPHPVSDDPAWHECPLLVWYDSAQRIGGFYRMHHEPNRGTGTVACQIVSATGPRYRYAREHVPLADADRLGNAFGLGPRHRVVWNGGVGLRVDEGACQIDLAFEDFHPRFRYWDLVGHGDGRDTIAPEHFELSGRVRGGLQLGPRRWEIDGFFHRDRSWGIRHWSTVLASRWCVGTVGPELCFSLAAYVSDKGRVNRAGYVVRNGRPEALRDIDILVHQEVDGLSFRGVSSSARLADGSRLEIESQVVDGAVYESSGSLLVQGIGPARAGGRTGFTDVEVLNHARRGTARPPVLVRAWMGDGLDEGPSPLGSPQ